MKIDTANPCIVIKYFSVFGKTVSYLVDLVFPQKSDKIMKMLDYHNGKEKKNRWLVMHWLFSWSILAISLKVRPRARRDPWGWRCLTATGFGPLPSCNCKCRHSEVPEGSSISLPPILYNHSVTDRVSYILRAPPESSLHFCSTGPFRAILKGQRRYDSCCHDNAFLVYLSRSGMENETWDRQMTTSWRNAVGFGEDFVSTIFSSWR